VREGEGEGEGEGNRISYGLGEAPTSRGSYSQMEEVSLGFSSTVKTQAPEATAVEEEEAKPTPKTNYLREVQPTPSICRRLDLQYLFALFSAMLFNKMI